MKIFTFTNVVVDSDTYLSCTLNEVEKTASLYLSNTPETLTIQFQPDHLPVLEMLVTQLSKLKQLKQELQRQELQRQLEALSSCHESENGNRQQYSCQETL